MNHSLNTVLSRLALFRSGPLERLGNLEELTYPGVHPEAVFPRIGQLRLGGSRAAQHTPVTCGTTVLALATALFDPGLLAHLRADDLRPPAPAAVGEEGRAARAAAREQRVRALKERAQVAEERFTAVQNRLLHRVTGRTWPTALGTPPWGLARELRVPGTVYDHLAVDDRNRALTEVLDGLLRRATDAGLPVPLYVGGSLATRTSAAAPRHVVLLLPPAAITGRPGNDYARIYDPSSGRVFRRSWSWLWARNKPDIALGGWTHLAWVVLPRPIPPAID